MACCQCGATADLARLFTREWCRSCFQKAWDEAMASSAPRAFLVSPEMARKLRQIIETPNGEGGNHGE